MSDSEKDSRKIWEKLVINTERSPEEVMEFYVEWAKTVNLAAKSSFGWHNMTCVLLCTNDWYTREGT